MPGSCEECDLCNDDGYCLAMHGDLCNDDGYCLAMHGDSLWDALPEGAEYFPTGWKYEGCPLVEVPAPHGDLIDIDSKITIGIKDGLKVTTVRKLLNDKAVRLPKTVIEAEGE